MVVSKKNLRLTAGITALLLFFVSHSRVIAQSSKTTKTERALANLQAQHREAHQLFGNDLERIAQTCEANGLNGIAPRIRKIAEPVDPDVLHFEPLPRQVQPAIPAPPENEFSWQ